MHKRWKLFRVTLLFCVCIFVALAVFHFHTHPHAHTHTRTHTRTRTRTHTHTYTRTHAHTHAHTHTHVHMHTHTHTHTHTHGCTHTQVQHILASTLPGGRSVVWDLRKNEPIIQVADSTSHMRCSAIAWHPDIATQMATASGDDHAPIIQVSQLQYPSPSLPLPPLPFPPLFSSFNSLLSFSSPPCFLLFLPSPQVWDLRYATAPMRTLEHHKRGILSLAWCPQDSDLLLSAAKDNQVFCWNPNSQEPGGEVHA